MFVRGRHLDGGACVGAVCLPQIQAWLVGPPAWWEVCIYAWEVGRAGLPKTYVKCISDVRVQDFFMAESMTGDYALARIKGVD